jgi:DNA-binding transcriptional ArsR family regulator
MSRIMDENVAMDGLGSLAQPTRLAVFRRLLAAHPGALAAGELAKACGAPHNTMSTHLGILTRAGLVHVERDGRTMNYRADLNAFRGLITFLTRDCCNGRPDLCGDIARLIPANDDEPEERVMTASFNVLFLCTHNSARSIMAEALLAKIGKGRFNGYSAGSDPGRTPQPEVLDRLKKLGHDVSGLPDPVDFKGSPTERVTLLNELYAMIRRRIEIFTSLPFATLDRMAMKARLDEIGDTARTAP